MSLTQQDATRLIATCNTGSPIDLRDRALIVTALETGMERQGLISMRLETVRMCSEGYPVAPITLKGSQLYQVPLSDAAMIAIEPWRQWLREQKRAKGPIFRPLKRRVARSGMLVYEVGDEQLSPASIYKIITGRAHEAGLVDIHPHTLREAFIAWRAAAGTPMHQIAAITGHRITSLSSAFHSERVGREARTTTPPWLTKLVAR